MLPLVCGNCGVHCVELSIPSPWNSASASVGSVKLRNGFADRLIYETRPSQLSLTTCNVEGLVVVGLHSVVAFLTVADNVN